MKELAEWKIIWLVKLFSATEEMGIVKSFALQVAWGQ